MSRFSNWWYGRGFSASSFSPLDLNAIYAAYIALPGTCSTDAAQDFDTGSGLSGFLQAGITGAEFDALVTDTGQPLTAWGWARFDNVAANAEVLHHVWDLSDNGRRQWNATRDSNGNLRMAFVVPGGSQRSFVHSTVLNPGVWHFWCFRLVFNVADNRTDIKINLDGTPMEFGQSSLGEQVGPPSLAATDIQVGSRGINQFMDGQQQAMGYARNTELSDADVALLYNGGTPLLYSQLPASIQAASTYFFNGHDRAGGLTDATGNRANIPAINSQGVAQGLATGPCQNNSPVKFWQDLIGSRDLLQATFAAQPTFISDGLNGEPVVRFNGVDQAILAAGGAGLNPPWTMHGVATPQDVTQDDGNLWGTGSSRYEISHPATDGEWRARGGVGNFSTTGTQAVNGVTNRIQAVFDATGQLVLDGVQQVATDFSGQVLTSIVMGARDGSGTNLPWTGDCPLLVMQNAIPTAQELADMDAWMKDRYGL